MINVYLSLEAMKPYTPLLIGMVPILIDLELQTRNDVKVLHDNSKGYLMTIENVATPHLKLPFFC